MIGRRKQALHFCFHAGWAGEAYLRVIQVDQLEGVDDGLGHASLAHGYDHLMEEAGGGAHRATVGAWLQRLQKRSSQLHKWLDLQPNTFSSIPWFQTPQQMAMLHLQMLKGQMLCA